MPSSLAASAAATSACVATVDADKLGQPRKPARFLVERSDATRWRCVAPRRRRSRVGLFRSDGEPPGDRNDESHHRRGALDARGRVGRGGRIQFQQSRILASTSPDLRAMCPIDRRLRASRSDSRDRAGDHERRGVVHPRAHPARDRGDRGTRVHEPDSLHRSRSTFTQGMPSPCEGASLRRVTVPRTVATVNSVSCVDQRRCYAAASAYRSTRRAPCLPRCSSRGMPAVTARSARRARTPPPRRSAPGPDV